MAPSTPNNGLADQLVASLLPSEISAPKLRKYRDLFSRKLKIHNYARTNQFEVSERLDLLQERCQILNNDELADALHARVLKLKHLSEKWVPDALDLLLRLSDEPINKTKIELLANIGHQRVVVPSLTWAQLEADDPVGHNDEIWRVAEYSDFSSDDEVHDVVAATPMQYTTNPLGEEQGDLWQVKVEHIDPDVGPKALDHLRGAQFWQNVLDESLELTELQVIREVLFMLQGLPTALFWKVGNQFEIDKRFRLKNASRESFVNIISDFGQIATRLDLLRSFVQRAQSVRFMQTLRCAIEEKLHDLDAQLYSLEQNILVVETEVAATILQLSESVGKIVKATGWLADFVEEFDSKDLDAIQILEMLFDRTCQIQASNDESSFECCSGLFSRCFETYFKPLQVWMDQGTLLEDKATIFVTALQSEQGLSGLWKKWYKMADNSAPSRSPNFLEPFKAQIFNAGKTVVFLQHLKESTEPPTGSSRLELQQLRWNSASSLLPFPEVFAGSIRELVESRLRVATSALREQLGHTCGLWQTLDALQSIYFGKNGHVTDLIDTKIFTAIDRCDRGWNDRFLLGDLLQTVFEPIESVQAERLTILSSSHPSKDLSRRRQSVKLLRDLRIQDALPWSVANVITRASLTTYQRISTFLTQTRRARYVLERRSLFQVRRGRPGADQQERNLNQSLHRSLLLFINILYDHLTSLVIEEANTELHKKLTNAIDIDAMIAAHNRYCSTLEDACLTSKKFKPIHSEIIAILDLCIRFSDLNNPTQTPGSSDADADADADSYVSATSHQYRRRRHRPNQAQEATSSSDDDVESDDGGEGYSTFIVPEESTLIEQLRKVGKELETHRAFVVAGLGSIGRVGEQEGGGWEILARRLGWEKELRYR
jgi:gamma-tubulin complex component 5